MRGQGSGAYGGMGSGCGEAHLKLMSWLKTKIIYLEDSLGVQVATGCSEERICYKNTGDRDFCLLLRGHLQYIVLPFLWI